MNHPNTSGRMRWLAYPEAIPTWFSPSPLTIHPLAWDDWPALNVTAVQLPAGPEDPPRSWAFYLPDHGTAEGTFSGVLPDWARLFGKRPREIPTHAVTLRSQTGAVAGWLIVLPDPLSFGAARLVDLYLHSAYHHTADTLVTALQEISPDTPLTAYLTDPTGYRARALTAAGFHAVATLPAWLSQEGRIWDVHAFRKSQ